jgi:uncharacterized protein (TIGR02452 family)
MNIERRAAETLELCRRGGYRTETGFEVDISVKVAAAVKGSLLYRPAQLDGVAAPPAGPPRRAIEVTGETTAEAARRLHEPSRPRAVVALNFASAVSVGGGFLKGSKAQEEDLCRAFALYPCLEPHREYYQANRAAGSSLYTDHAIWSPEVPSFRDERGTLIEHPFPVSIITMPAPNRRHLTGHPHESRPCALPSTGELDRY